MPLPVLLRKSRRAGPRSFSRHHGDLPPGGQPAATGDIVTVREPSATSDRGRAQQFAASHPADTRGHCLRDNNRSIHNRNSNAPANWPRGIYDLSVQVPSRDRDQQLPFAIAPENHRGCQGPSLRATRPTVPCTTIPATGPGGNSLSSVISSIGADRSPRQRIRPHLPMPISIRLAASCGCGFA